MPVSTIRNPANEMRGITLREVHSAKRQVSGAARARDFSIALLIGDSFVTMRLAVCNIAVICGS